MDVRSSRPRRAATRSVPPTIPLTGMRRRSVLWERPQLGPTASKHWAGVLDTAGGVLLHGDPNGDFVAVDERDGKLLWHFPTNEVIKASPMTYTVAGTQFIALAVGSNIMCFGLP